MALGVSKRLVVGQLWIAVQVELSLDPPQRSERGPERSQDGVLVNVCEVGE